MDANYFDSLVQLRSEFTQWDKGFDQLKTNIGFREDPFCFAGKLMIDDVEVEDFFCLADSPFYNWFSVVGDCPPNIHFGAFKPDTTRFPPNLLLIPGLQKTPHLLDPASLYFWRSSCFFRMDFCSESRRTALGEGEIRISDLKSSATIARFLINSTNSLLLAREHIEGEHTVLLVVSHLVFEVEEQPEMLRLVALQLPDQNSGEFFVNKTAFLRKFGLDSWEPEVIAALFDRHID